MFLARVGYFEGTDPLLLSTLAAEGVETLPLANTWDGHGKYVNHLTKGEVNVVVGYFHKIIPVEQERTAMFQLILDSLLSACKIYEVPVLLIVPANMHQKAKAIIGETGKFLHLVSPEEVEAQIRKHLK